MTRVTKFVHYALGYIILECHQNEALCVVQHCMTGRSSHLHLRFEVIIQVDGDYFVPRSLR